MRSIIILILLTILIGSCYNKQNKQNTEQVKEQLNIPPVKTGSFYATQMNKDNAIVIADTITYSVVTKSALPDDEWENYCLRKMDNIALANIIFNAIYNGRLTAYDYQNEEAMSIEDVKALEKKYKRDNIAKIQFVEEWYFDEKSLQMGKRVNELMLAYELRNEDDGQVRGYKAGVKVFLNKKHP